MKKIKLLKTLLIPTLGISTIGIVATVATSCNNSTYSVTGGSLTLKGVHGTADSDKKEWKLTIGGQRIIEDVIWSIVEPVSGISIIDGKVSWTNTIESGTYKFKAAANYNNQTYTSEDITLNIASKYEVTGGSVELFGSRGVSGSDNKTWILKKDGEVITEGITWSIVEPVSGVSINNGKVSWTDTIESGTYKFKVSATYLDRTSTTDEITLTINDVYEVKGLSKKIDVVINHPGYDKGNSWLLVESETGEVVTEGVTWKLVATEGSSVPEWIKLNENNEISWTNTVKGTYAFYIQATYDEKIYTSSSPFILKVGDATYDSLEITPDKDGTFEVVNYGGNNPNLLYSFDESNWNEYSQQMNIQKGQTLYLRGDNPDGWSHHSYSYSRFRITGDISVSGNVMALLDNGAKAGEEGYITDIPSDYCFYNLFAENIDLKRVDENSLPATTLKNYCYFEMFKGCVSLTRGPELPADVLTKFCYFSMFENCTRLERVPELPATTLAEACYNAMFANCSNLTKATTLPATTLEIGCYSEMFYQCDKLSKAPKLPATTLAEACYSSMFEKCTSLTEAPELPATTLSALCYSSMFENCTALAKAPELPAIFLPEKCYLEMFRGCSSIQEPPRIPAQSVSKESCKYMFADCTSLVYTTELLSVVAEEGCYFGMFENCTSLVTAYNINAVQVANSCFENMFYNCNKLISVRIAYTGIPNPIAKDFYNWVVNVGNVGIFYYSGEEITSAQVFGFPANWQIVKS